MTERRKPDRRIRELILPEDPEPGITYIPSQFVVPVPSAGSSCLFNTLTGQCIEAELPASATAGAGFDELIEARFLVPEGLDESAFYSYVFSLMQLAKPESKVAGCTILPTLACNARCVYCYEEGMQPVSMTEETAEQAVRYLLSIRADRLLRLSWFGGEPLLLPDVIDRICLGLQAAGAPYRSSMISNGSLITPGILEKMTGLWRLRNIQISMDGAEEDYRSRKRYLRYNGVYQRVIGAVESMAEAGIRVSIRYNVDEGNLERIPRFLEDLKAGVADRRRVSVYLAPLNAVRESENAVVVWDGIRDAKRLIDDAGFRSADIIRLPRAFRTSHCMADRGAPVIAPGGSLYACEHCPPEARYGDVWNGVTDEAARKAFCRTDLVRPSCRRCPYLPLCTGFQSCPVRDRDCRNVIRRALDELFSRLPSSGG